MKNILLIVILMFISFEKQVELDYCKMLEEDQSFLDNSEERNKIFEKNFNQILEKTRKEGFPTVSFKDSKTDSCKYWSVTATLIHIVQSKPELLFDQEVIELFKKEMDKGNMDNDLLIPAFKISSKTREFCDTLKSKIEYSTNLWGLNSSLIKEIKYKECQIN